MLVFVGTQSRRTHFVCKILHSGQIQFRVRDGEGSFRGREHRVSPRPFSIFNRSELNKKLQNIIKKSFLSNTNGIVERYDQKMNK